MRIPTAHRSLLAGLVALVLLYAAAAARYQDRGFLSVDVAVNLLGGNAVLGLMAVGMTFVILSGGIDLSVGAVMGLSSVVVGVLITNHGWPAVAAMPVALALGAALGAGMGAMVHHAGLKPFVVTLAGMFFARGLGFMIQLAPDDIRDATHAAIAAAGREALGVPTTAVVFLAAVGVAGYVLRFRPFGRAVHALGGDPDAARLMGVRIGRTQVLTYAVSGFCSALAGIVLTLETSSGSHLEGVGMELDAIAAVVIGGTLLTGGVGSVFGTFVGVLIIGVIVIIPMYENIGSGQTRIVIGLLLLVFVMLQRLLVGRSAAR